MAHALVLAEGALGTDEGKTAHGLILHSLRDTIVAIIDSTKAGRDAGTLVDGRARGIPVVASLDEGLRRGDIQALYIGAAPVGGRLPASYRATIRAALEAGLTVHSGLHTFLGDDADFRRAAEAGGGRIIDVRRPPDELTVATGSLRGSPVPRILVMGTDCAVGKRITTFELVRAARQRGLDAGLVATGQTGCMLGADAGTVIDRVPADFCAGEVERLFVQVASERRDVIFGYGQSSILHPAYSGVALAILHGAAPHAIVLQHDPVRRQRVLFSHPEYQVADLVHEIDLIERLGGARVTGIAVNGRDCADVEAACRALAERTGRPALDPLRMDPTPLLEAALTEARARASVVAGGPTAPA